MAPVAINEDEKNTAVVPLKPHGKEGLTPLQAISQGVSLPGIPLYSDMDKQRHFILSHMAAAFRVFARKGFTEGMAGHISVRDPEVIHPIPPPPQLSPL